jgi:hypothetical protein
LIKKINYTPPQFDKGVTKQQINILITLSTSNVEEVEEVEKME